jgi:diguanylate cyclase (GGDEF)-like protein
MDSKVGLIIQITGSALVSLLLLLLTRSLPARALRYWAAGWCCLVFALVSLYVNFKTGGLAAKLGAVGYYFGEYVFGFFLVAGCRNFASQGEKGAPVWPLAIGLVVAVGLVLAPGGFNAVYNIHTFILATMFAVAFNSLKPARHYLQDSLGWIATRAALLLLALDFYHYAISFSLQNSPYFKGAFLSGYFTFNSVIDMVTEVLLGFGMVIILLEEVRLKIMATNAELRSAHDQLERLARVDPLTDAFTRHAFQQLLQNRSKAHVAGCVGVFDLDNLKPINDKYGHNAGDAAIRAVATAVRSLLRADDLLFRWGGDEFFVLMFGFDRESAIKRMSTLPTLLARVAPYGQNETFAVAVSYGFADFIELSDIENAIKTADAAMYQAKQQHKAEAAITA